MGRLSAKKIEQIKKAYDEDPNAAHVAKKLGVDSRSVRKYAQEQLPPPDKQIIQSTSEIQGNPKQKSESSRFFQLKKKGVSNVDIAIKLDLDGPKVEQYDLQFYRLKGLDALEKAYRESSVKGLESVSELTSRMTRDSMDVIEYATRLKRVGDLLDLDKDFDAVRRQTADAQSQLEKIENLTKEKSKYFEESASRAHEVMTQIDNVVKSKKESAKRLDSIWKEEIQKIVQAKVDQLFQDPWESTYVLAKSAMEVLKDQGKYDSMKRYLTNKDHSEQETKDYKNIVHYIVIQFNADIAKKLQEQSEKAVQRLSEHYDAEYIYGFRAAPA
jgi:hypothetical protein